MSYRFRKPLISAYKYGQIAFPAASTAFASKFVPQIRVRSKASLIVAH
jgi:hypothetical protein